MFFMNSFDGGSYSAITVNFGGTPKKYSWDEYLDVDDLRPRKRPDEITYEWVEEELRRAAARDMKDNFYLDNDQRMQSLGDVMWIYKYPLILVFDDNGYLYGKVSYFESEDDLSINIMYLYVFGDRRRRISNRQNNFINGIFIMWYFAAQMSKKIYGNVGRVLVVLPRDTIYKYLNKLEARFVEIHGINDKIGDTSNFFHYRVQKNMGGMDFGALFSAPSVIVMIDQLEGACVINRRG